MELTELALAVSILALLTSLSALRRASRAEAALAAEQVARLSASGAAEAQARIADGRLQAVETRVGKGNAVTAAKRDRALELLAAGAAESAIAREVGLREAEVCALAQLRASA